MTVREVVRSGFVARWLYRRGWRAVTLPRLLGGAMIRYWQPDSQEFPGIDPLDLIDPEVRAHEWIHVRQIRLYGRFGFIRKYLTELWAGYRGWRRFQADYRAGVLSPGVVVNTSRRWALRRAYDCHSLEKEANTLAAISVRMC